MKKFIIFTSIILLCLSVASCSSPKIQDYSGTTPNLLLEEFFNGELSAYGVVLDHNGKLTRRFTVKLQASWKDNKGTIEEWFTFDDGEKSKRIWQLTKQDKNQYTGTANDVVGIAKGTTSGSALYWKYDLLINVDDTEYQVTLDDWMYLINSNLLFNKTDIIKYGIKVGVVNLYIEKHSI